MKETKEKGDLLKSNNWLVEKEEVHIEMGPSVSRACRYTGSEFEMSV